MKPFLKWAGGKGWLAERLADEIMSTFPGLYIEPFLGAGAVALALPESLPKRLSDINPHLMDLWRCVQTLPADLVRELIACEASYGNDADGFANARAYFNTIVRVPRPMWAFRSAHFLYLNARCFNGLWRTNGAGRFNVPFGKRENPRTYDRDEMLAYSSRLPPASTSLSMEGFTSALAREFSKRIVKIKGDANRMRTCMAGVAVYADPPYHETFDGYAKEGFGEMDHTLLAGQLESLAAAGASVWTSNADTPLVRALYSWAQIEEIEEQHNVGSKAERRGKRSCLLIRGGGAKR